MTEFVIYTITNIVNGKKYVGQSVETNKRWIRHKYHLNAGTHHSSKLQRAWEKYGAENFVFEIVAEAQSQDALDELEKHFVAKFNSFNKGYNMNEGSCVAKIKYRAIGMESPTRRMQKPQEQPDMARNFFTYWHRKGVFCDEGVTPRYKVACTWNGQDYESLSEACEANSIRCVATLKYWLSRGHTCDDDLTTNNKPCSWNGQEYASVSEAADALGIGVSTLSNRLLKGYTSDSELVGVIGLPKPTVWNGIEYPSLKAAAKANNIEYLSTLADWLSKGYNCDAEVPRRKRRTNARNK